MTARNVEIIPAKPKFIRQGLTEQPKLKVAAYCRVSTSEEEQISSFEAQREYYNSYISNNSAWEFAGIYADEGISGTNTKKRAEFNRMIDDCLAGKIDMVVTKSVSRFARNTLDCLQYIRLLKEQNIAVYFEKENINTLDAKGEVLLVIISSLAQEESFALSHNTRWGIVQRFQTGKVLVNHNRFLGYTKDDNGELVIVPEEAQIVRRIYSEFLAGKSSRKIAKSLTEDGLINGAGNAKWHESNIISILKNEKYMGDALLQKTYTVDFLNKKRSKNKGVVQQYYVENSHPAIISKEDFAAVQAEFTRRSTMRGYSGTGKSQYTCQYPFSGMLYCYDCGAKLRRSSWGTGKNTKYIWKCINKEINGIDSCNAKDIRETDLEQAFVRAMNKVIGDKDDFLQNLMANIYRGLAMVQQEYTLEEVETKLKELQNGMMNLVRLNAKAMNGVAALEKEYAKIANEIEKMNERKQKLKDAELDKILRQNRVAEIQEYLRSQDTPMGKFDGVLFRRLIDRVIVHSFVEVTFIFRTGVEVKEILG